MRIAVVGNGILGLMSAYELHRRDPRAEIVVIGDPACTGSASLAAGAMLHAFCELEAGALDDPLRRQRFEFSRAASALWPPLLRELAASNGLTIHHGAASVLVCTEGEGSIAACNFTAVLSALRAHGEPHRLLAANECARLGLPPETRAVSVEREGWVNPRQVMQALQTVLERSPRVGFVAQDAACLRLAQDRVTGVELADGSLIAIDAVIACNGARFSGLMQDSGLGGRFQPICYGLGVSLLLEAPAPSHCLRTPLRGPGMTAYCVPHSSDCVSVGATFQLCDRPDLAVSAPDVGHLLAAARDLLQRDFSRAAIRQTRLGWRPVSADGLPLIGPTSVGGLFVATGTRRDGFHCAPLIAVVAARWALGGARMPIAAAFNPERAFAPIQTLRQAAS